MHTLLHCLLTIFIECCPADLLTAQIAYRVLVLHSLSTLMLLMWKSFPSKEKIATGCVEGKIAHKAGVDNGRYTRFDIIVFRIVQFLRLSYSFAVQHYGVCLRLLGFVARIMLPCIFVFNMVCRWISSCYRTWLRIFDSISRSIGRCVFVIVFFVFCVLDIVRIIGCSVRDFLFS